MLSSRNIVVHFVFVYCVGAPHVPGQVSRDIAPTDTILHVVNEIFSCLKIKLNGNSNKKKLPTHNYFIGFSQYKSNNWKEILRLTSFDIKIDNSSKYYMSTVINEVLNGGNKTVGGIEIRNDVSVTKESKNFLRKLKEAYLRNIPYSTLNNKTSQLLPNRRTSHSTYGENTVASELNLAENGTEDIEVWVPSQSRRIFRGQQTRIHYYPFMASIHIFTQFSCAGSIIDADLVITAASCLQLAYNNRFHRENPQFLTVRVGSSYYDGVGDLIPVLEVYFHPSYDPPTLHNNLAILRLHRYFRFRDRSSVKKIDIDTNANALPTNTDGIVIVGWGARTASNKMMSPINKIAESVLDFYPLEECQEIYSKTYVTERHFCAGFVSRGGGACNRDVGAPGLAGGLLVGVVSFGSASCGAADSPTVFTKLGFYTDWIEEIMAQETSDYINMPTATYRPHPIQTVMTKTPINHDFAIEPIKIRAPPLMQFNDQDTKEYQTAYQYYPIVSYVSNEEPAINEQQFTNKEQMVDGNIELAQLTKNKNTHEHADLSPAQYISFATTTHNFILREDLLQFTPLDKLPQTYKGKTKSIVAEQLPKPDHSIGPVGSPGGDEYTEATPKTKLDVLQLVQLDTMDDDVVDKLIEIDTELDKKYTKTDKLPQKNEIKITTNKVLEQQSMDVRQVDLTGLKKKTESELTSNLEPFVSLRTKGDSFFGDNKSLNNAAQEFAMNFPEAKKSYEVMATQVTKNALPEKLSSNGKILGRTPLEKLADPPTTDERDLVIEQPKGTFSDPGLNQQINELIDYMKIINLISSEQENPSDLEYIIGTKKSQELNK